MNPSSLVVSLSNCESNNPPWELCASTHVMLTSLQRGLMAVIELGRDYTHPYKGVEVEGGNQHLQS